MTHFRRPDRDPDLEVELTLLETNRGGPRDPMLTGIRVPHDFGLHDELNDGMYEFLHGDILSPGETRRAFVWLLAPERNAGRLSPGFEFKVWNGGWIGKGRILRVLNAQLKRNAESGAPPTDAAIDILYNEAHDRRAVIFRRASGTYGYREEYHYKDDVAEGWASLGGRACYWDSLETARKEVAENVSWLPKHRNSQ